MMMLDLVDELRKDEKKHIDACLFTIKFHIFLIKSSMLPLLKFMHKLVQTEEAYLKTDLGYKYYVWILYKFIKDLGLLIEAYKLRRKIEKEV